MLKLYNEKDIDGISIDAQIKSIARKTLKILDEAYGAHRKPLADLGGFVVILESKEEIEQLKDYHVDLEVDVPEYVDHVIGDEKDWIVALYLLSSDFSITVIMPAGMSTPDPSINTEMLFDSAAQYHL